MSALEMRGVFDRLPGVVAAGVPRELRRPVDDADRGGTGEQRHRAADVRVGNRVPIPVEGHVRAACARATARSTSVSKGCAGSGSRRALLLGEDVRPRSDRAARDGAADARCRRASAGIGH